MIEQTDGFEIMNQIMAVKIKKPNKGNNQTDRSGRSNQLRMNSNGSDFRWSDFQRVLTRQYDRNSFGLPLRDSEIPNHQNEELLVSVKN